MAFSNQTPTNWGCIVATVIAVPLALFVFLADMMAGGGCEGRPDPCEPDYSDKWLMLGGLAIGALLFAKAVNVIIAGSRRWRRD